jgi:hypothetical protein
MNWSEALAICEKGGDHVQAHRRYGFAICDLEVAPKIAFGEVKKLGRPTHVGSYEPPVRRIVGVPLQLPLSFGVK